mgnify:CR=1 FL=1
MRSARLELALHSGALVLPAQGDIVVLRPRAGDDLSALPHDRVVVKTGFKPDHDYFAAQGYRSEGVGRVAIVCVPRAKAEAFEVALANVSTALAAAARKTAAELKAERIAAARGEGAPAVAKAPARGRAAAATPATRRTRNDSSAVKKKNASTLATGARRQAKRDSR